MGFPPCHGRKRTPGGAVELTDDDPLGAVDNERAVLGHQGKFTEIDFLLFDIANRLGTGIAFHIPGNQSDP